MRSLSRFALPYLLFALVCSACGDEDIEGEGDGAEETCLESERLNPITGFCEARSGGDGPQDPGDGTPPGDGSTPGNPQDPGDGTPPGGDPNNGGGVPEFCGPNMDLNSELDCSFYAHTPSTLYRIDPFRQTIETIMDTPSGLTDVDTHPDGMLFGITFTDLYKFEAGATDWEHVGRLSPSSTANGLCINTVGEAFMTAGSNLYRLDLETAQVTNVGSMGSGIFSSISSSGDCVFDKGDRLFMSSSGGMSQGDDLVGIDSQSAEARVIGNTGFAQIYGLTAAWGLLFGTTGKGEVILIDRDTGQSELVYQPPGNLVFHGAASTPAR